MRTELAARPLVDETMKLVEPVKVGVGRAGLDDFRWGEDLAGERDDEEFAAGGFPGDDRGPEEGAVHGGMGAVEELNDGAGFEEVVVEELAVVVFDFDAGFAVGVEAGQPFGGGGWYAGDAEGDLGDVFGEAGDGDVDPGGLGEGGDEFGAFGGVGEVGAGEPGLGVEGAASG